MRSKTAKRILNETPQEVKDKVQDYANKLILYNVSGSTCKEHKPMSKQMGYVEWNEWADLKIRRGHIQRQCKKCGRWLFKCEQ